MMQPRMASLIPLLIANGLARVFVFSDFTQLVVKPQLGEDDIGFAMMAFGFTDAVSSYGFGKLSGSSRSNLILFFGTILHLSCLAFAGFGSYDAYAELKIYTVCAIWGIADGAWYTMIPAHLGAKFVEEPEAAFSVKTLWEAAAAATLLQITDLSLKTKASLVLGAVLLGNVGFLISLALSRNSSHEEGAESGHKGASVGAEPSVHGAINVHEGSNEKPTGVNATSYNELVNCVPNSQASNHEGCNNQTVEP